MLQRTNIGCLKVICYSTILILSFITQAVDSKSILKTNLEITSALDLNQQEEAALRNFDTHGFTNRLINRRSTRCFENCLIYTSKYSAKIEDKITGLQWHADPKSHSRVKPINDSKPFKWIIWVRDHVTMFSLESKTPGKYHFAYSPQQSDNIFLTEPLNAQEINLTASDLRYFSIFSSPQSHLNSIQHNDTGYYVAINSTRVKRLSLSEHDVSHNWNLEQ